MGLGCSMLFCALVCSIPLPKGICGEVLGVALFLHVDGRDGHSDIYE